MAAVKAYFYKLREDIPDVCEGVDIPRFLESLHIAFGRAALGGLDPATKLPEGPVFYSDTPRNCHEGAGKYELEDAISDCLRHYDKKGTARRALAELIADKAVSDPQFRERLLAYSRVPQAWTEILLPADPEAKPDRRKLADALEHLQDRDYGHPRNAKGRRHPLARIMESRSFSATEKLDFVTDYMIGRKREGEAPWAVRIGHRGNYREFNRASWLEQNGAFIVRTVGDLVRLQDHFTATNKLKRGPLPDLPKLEPGALKLDPK